MFEYTSLPLLPSCYKPIPLEDPHLKMDLYKSAAVWKVKKVHCVLRYWYALFTWVCTVYLNVHCLIGCALFTYRTTLLVPYSYVNNLKLILVKLFIIILQTCQYPFDSIYSLINFPHSSESGTSLTLNSQPMQYKSIQIKTKKRKT